MWEHTNAQERTLTKITYIQDADKVGKTLIMNCQLSSNPYDAKHLPTCEQMNYEFS